MQVLDIKDTGTDKFIFFKIFFNDQLKKLKLKAFGRKFFNPNQSKSLKAHGLEIWPGFESAMTTTEKGILLNIDTTHRVLRTDSVLNVLKELKNKGGNFHSEVEKSLIGSTVLTRYN